MCTGVPRQWYLGETSPVPLVTLRVQLSDTGWRKARGTGEPPCVSGWPEPLHCSQSQERGLVLCSDPALLRNPSSTQELEFASMPGRPTKLHGRTQQTAGALRQQLMCFRNAQSRGDPTPTPGGLFRCSTLTLLRGRVLPRATLPGKPSIPVIQVSPPAPCCPIRPPPNNPNAPDPLAQPAAATSAMGIASPGSWAPSPGAS